MRTISDRLWEKVNKTDECWNWTGAKDGFGYGVMQLGGRLNKFMAKAHRISYELAYGEFERKMFICHHCDNPSCVRPDHLFIGTQKDNMSDCASKGRTKGFKWTSENHPHKGKNRPAYVGEAVKKAKERPFSIVSPTGEVIHGVNFCQFCRDNGLNKSSLGDVRYGRVKSHKGYTRFIG